MTDFESRFYPGEAILGLVRLYERDQNTAWLDAAEKAADYIIQVRDKDAITPDHWFMYALNDLHRFRGKQDYLRHSLKMADEICKIQIRNHPEKPEWDGGYIVENPPPKATQAACYSEGLSASYKLIRDFGSQTEKEELGKIKQTISRGIDFQLQMQVKNTKRFNKKWLGGIQKSPEHEGIRIDYTQHNISSFILFYNILTRDQERNK
ncbi:hypothetical protein [Salisediminibacterium halotolerans]|uniref:hypothetical protein n=1 Tax=Salisediminibacterium halotolerans TaxID=517425 RepID=UPI00115FCF74|nr:hypothetical protein [Salisediminibacterium haloalkalitolerans]